MNPVTRMSPVFCMNIDTLPTNTAVSTPDQAVTSILVSKRLATALLLASLGVTTILNAAAAAAETPPRLSASADDLQRLGVEFALLQTSSSLTLSSANGITDVEAADQRTLLMPFDARVEEWQIPSPAHVATGTSLVRLHSHDALAFLQGHKRLQAETSLCNERLGYLKERQRTGISSKLDVQEKNLECQQLNDQLQVNQEVLEHLPSAWRNSSKAEFSLAASESGWLMSVYRQAGQMADESSGLGLFWPDQALKVRASISSQLAGQLQTGQQLELVRLDDPQQTPYQATLVRIGSSPDTAGLVSVWLQTDAIKPVPGQRWTIKLQSAQQGLVIPASARIRYHDQSWVFVQNSDGLQPTTITPLAEGNGELLLPAEMLNTRIAIKGTAALSAFWQNEGAE
jgi:membrane fusion protein, heavy metal efflux system